MANCETVRTTAKTVMVDRQTVSTTTRTVMAIAKLIQIKRLCCIPEVIPICSTVFIVLFAAQCLPQRFNIPFHQGEIVFVMLHIIVCQHAKIMQCKCFGSNFLAYNLCWFG